MTAEAIGGLIDAGPRLHHGFRLHRSRRFYDAIMKALDVVKVGRSDRWLGYGERADADIRTASTSPSTRARGRTRPPAGIGASRRKREAGGCVLARRYRRGRHRDGAPGLRDYHPPITAHSCAIPTATRSRRCVTARCSKRKEIVARMSEAIRGCGGSILGA